MYYLLFIDCRKIIVPLKVIMSRFNKIDFSRPGFGQMSGKSKLNPKVFKVQGSPNRFKVGKTKFKRIITY